MSVAGRLRGVDRAFALPTGPVAALRGLDLDVPRTGLTVVSGPSGCGKTTLLNIVTGAESVDAGTVEVCGLDIARLSKRQRRRFRRTMLGIALARPSDNLVDRLDVDANVRMASRMRRVRVDVSATVGSVGLTAGGRARVAELSGGEQQRLAIALAFLGDPRLVVLDEPTAELDALTGRGIVDYLRGQSSRRALLVASHDPCVVDAADVLVLLEAGARVG